MKKLLLLLCCVLAPCAFGQFSAVVDAGRLKGFNGASMPTGSLLLLISAGPDGSFSNSLGSGQYVSGDDTILAVQSFNMFGGDQSMQPTDEFFGSFIDNNTTTPGQLIALRWFPTITLAQFNIAITPSNGDHFGTYNPLAVGNPNNNPDGGDPWAVPGAGSQITLFFITTDSTPPAGTQNPMFGWANLTVIPEPSTYLLFSIGLATAVWARRRLKPAA